MDRATASELLSGGVGGAVGVFIGQPFDCIKVRLQSLGDTYSGSFDCLAKTIRQEGVLGLYRGVLPPVLNSFLLNAIMFGGYGHGQRVVQEYTSLSHTQRAFWAGSWAGLLGVTALVPFDLVKCQMQVDRAGGRAGQFKDGIHCARTIIAREGVQGLYRGVLVSAVRDSPPTGVYFVAFEHMEAKLPRWTPALAGDPATFLAGGVAGIVTWAVAYPVDTVKTYMQTLPIDAPAHERSILRVLRVIQAEHGVSYLFRGLGTCLVRAFPVNAVTFVVYKRAKAMLATSEA
jgi:hypothetical protein